MATVVLAVLVAERSRSVGELVPRFLAGWGELLRLRRDERL